MGFIERIEAKVRAAIREKIRIHLGKPSPGTTWFSLANSGLANQMTFPINPANPGVFSGYCARGRCGKANSGEINYELVAALRLRVSVFFDSVISLAPFHIQLGYAPVGSARWDHGLAGQLVRRG